jgi:hypothetical protein
MGRIPVDRQSEHCRTSLDDSLLKPISTPRWENCRFFGNFSVKNRQILKPFATDSWKLALAESQTGLPWENEVELKTCEIDGRLDVAVDLGIDRGRGRAKEEKAR